MQTRIFNEGYRAQAGGQTLQHNPYASGDPHHWTWRKGFLQAHMDSN